MLNKMLGIDELKDALGKLSERQESLEGFVKSCAGLEERVTALEKENARLKAEIGLLRNESDKVWDKVQSIQDSLNRSRPSATAPGYRRAQEGAVGNVSGTAAPVEPKVVAQPRTFYAMVNTDGELEEVDNDYRTQVPFVATVKGESGEVRFNPECLPGCLGSIESDILPYFEYTINTSRPSRITPKNTARIKRKGDAWEMENKIKIEIS